MVNFCEVNYSKVTCLFWVFVKLSQSLYKLIDTCFVPINSHSYRIKHCSNALKLTSLPSSLQIKILSSTFSMKLITVSSVNML